MEEEQDKLVPFSRKLVVPDLVDTEPLDMAIPEPPFIAKAGIAMQVTDNDTRTDINDRRRIYQAVRSSEQWTDAASASVVETVNFTTAQLPAVTEVVPEEVPVVFAEVLIITCAFEV